MGKILVIAEKPSAGKDIARILNVTELHKGYIESEQYIVTWAIGHLIGLKQPDEVDERFKQWRIEDLPLPTDNGLKVKKDTASQFKVIKELIARGDVERIINAGDAGREGLLIQSWIYRMAGNKRPVDILWASSLTDEAIKKAMEHLHSAEETEFVNLLREAETRAEADLKYGFNYSRLLTLLYAEKGTVLSYGRCQTPLLYLIYKRDMEYINFKSTPYWTIEVTYAKGFSGSIIDTETGSKVRYIKKDVAEAIVSECKGKFGKVSSYISETKENKAPALYNLGELQSVMGKKYGYTPDKTLQIAQRLYETHKILSYPRTDSRYLSNDIFNEIQEHLQSCTFGKFSTYVNHINLGNLKLDKSYFNDNKVSDHHALIPTIQPNISQIYETLSEEERRCFDEVVVSFIAIFLSPYKYKTTEVKADIGKYTCLSNGTVIEDIGYKKVYSILKSQNVASDGKQELQILPQLEEGHILAVDSMEFKEEKTKPPTRYHPGNIIKLMNKYGIGTSATAAEIIKTLEKRGFIHLEKGKYAATTLGAEFIKVVPDELKSPNLTKEFEENLLRVNSGELSSKSFLADIDTQIQKHIEKFKNDSPKTKLGNQESEAIGKCPLCGCQMKGGKTKNGKENWYCTGYRNNPACSFKIWRNIAGKNISEAQVQELLTKGITNLIKGFNGKSGKFDARLKFDSDFKIIFDFSKNKKSQ